MMIQVGYSGPESFEELFEFFPKQTGTVGVLSSEEKGTRLAGWVARGSGAGGPRSLDRWHTALELARGWVARGFGAGAPWSLGGTQLWAGVAEFGWVWRGHGEFGGGTRLWSRAPAVLMHVPGIFNIDGLSAGWVTACTYTC